MHGSRAFPGMVPRRFRGKSHGPQEAEILPSQIDRFIPRSDHQRWCWSELNYGWGAWMLQDEPKAVQMLGQTLSTYRHLLHFRVCWI